MRTTVKAIVATLAIAVAPALLAQAASGPTIDAEQGLVTNPAAIVATAAASSCAKHVWGRDQGVAPSGYIKGVALSFAQNYCASRTASSRIAALLGAPLGAPVRDGLALYSTRFVRSIPVATPLQRLESTYGILLGMGMVESSGRTQIAAPYDSANPHPVALTAEAGLYQTSANSLSADPLLPALVGYFTAHPEQCAFDLFTGGRKPKITPPVGEAGPSTAFQQLTKTCPAFATQYAAIMIRKKRRHYGTLNVGHAEYARACQPMFAAIEAQVTCGPASPAP